MFEEEVIEIPKTEIFLKSSKELSDYILKLNIPNNDEFVKLLLKHTITTRKEAFKSGIEWAFKQLGII